MNMSGLLGIRIWGGRFYVLKVYILFLSVRLKCNAFEEMLKEPGFGLCWQLAFQLVTYFASLQTNKQNMSNHTWAMNSLGKHKFEKLGSFECPSKCELIQPWVFSSAGYLSVPLNLMLISAVASPKGAVSWRREKVCLFADLKEIETWGKPQTLWLCFLTMTPTCWPNQTWKIVTFLTMFLGMRLSQGKHTFLHLKYLTLVRV